MPSCKDIESEEYDLVRSGADADLVLTNLEYDLLPVFQRMTDALGLVSVDKKELQTRVHIQQPGQVWNLHIDKLEKFNKADPHSVYRFMIMLNDWEPGHFYCFDNNMHTNWKAGDVYSVDWHNSSYASANAGTSNRIILQLTGLLSEEYNEFLARLKRFDKYTLELKENSW